MFSIEGGRSEHAELQVSEHEWYCEFTGTKAALTAAGVVQDGNFPGDPLWLRKTLVEFSEATRNGSVRRAAKRRFRVKIWRLNSEARVIRWAQWPEGDEKRFESPSEFRAHVLRGMQIFRSGALALYPGAETEQQGPLRFAFAPEVESQVCASFDKVCAAFDKLLSIVQNGPIIETGARELPPGVVDFTLAKAKRGR